MKLIIAEKPSVAAVLAKVVSADAKVDGFYSGNGCLVSWRIGHLVKLAVPDAYNQDYPKRALKDLPIILAERQTVVKPDTKKQFNALTGLLRRSNMEKIICATDVGQYQEVTKHTEAR